MCHVTGPRRPAHASGQARGFLGNSSAEIRLSSLCFWFLLLYPVSHICALLIKVCINLLTTLENDGYLEVEDPPKILVEGRAVILEECVYSFVQTLRIIPVVQGPLYLDTKISTLGDL